MSVSEHRQENEVNRACLRVFQYWLFKNILTCSCPQSVSHLGMFWGNVNKGPPYKSHQLGPHVVTVSQHGFYGQLQCYYL